MNLNAQNPFRFGGPVEGDFYLARPELERTITNFLENRIHVVLIGPRRFGKTSFALHLLKTLENQGFVSLFIDVFNITSHRDFLQQLLRSIRSRKTWGHKFKEWVDSLPRLRPKLTIEPDATNGGQLSFALSANTDSPKDVKEAIQDVLAGLNVFGEKLIVTVDEFQKIAEIDDQGWLEATLRTQMQQNKNASFLFTGSRKSLIHRMINDQARPFYRSIQPIEFPSFGDEFNHWIHKKLKSSGVSCDMDVISYLRKSVQETPNYVQMVCFHIIAGGLKKVGKAEIDETLKSIVKQNAYAYQTLLMTLSDVQQRSLRLAANEPNQVFSKESLVKYEISSGAALASAFKALKNKQILDDEGTTKGRVIFDDPLFAIWLKAEFGT